MTDNDLPDSVDKKQINRIMERVLKAEKNKLHMGSPKGINNDIEQIIKEEVD
ncbi:hypothetical protein [Haloquadratum walsbyi]|jgi:hypothetical protein|uniref:Uncharacterized protein n=1 Tax=Haloquadratum walsbyi J07HQW2 TaxID=1238425 RepID=U1PTS6_9EURY|nr:hypothetical protein [Haloquadratum walsbyi]ERG97212.1 MAG: hypothetical protein J07HQW2_03698 [Haloquadratum walsbyi J07HQW2]